MPFSQKTSNNSRDYDIVPQKIILKKLCYNIEAFYDEIGLIPINTTYCIISDDANLKYILAVINSRLLTFYARKKYINTSLRGGYIELRVFQLEQLPIPQIPLSEQEPFIVLAEKMLSLTDRLHKCRHHFLQLVTDNFPGVKITRVLENFTSLSFADFLTEMEKQKHRIPLKFRGEWNECFTQAVTECRQLSETIAQTDTEIDRLVYELYALTTEEIGIIEGGK